MITKPRKASAVARATFHKPRCIIPHQNFVTITLFFFKVGLNFQTILTHVAGLTETNGLKMIRKNTRGLSYDTITDFSWIEQVSQEIQ